MPFPVMLPRQVAQAVRLPIGFFAVLFFIMAVTKVSSTVHYASRRSAVSGRGGAASGHWVPNTDVYTTDTGLVVKV